MFSTTAVAIALGIGRKGILQIPVKPALIWKKQRYYRKGDVMQWAIEDGKRGEESVLLGLRRKYKKR